MVKIVEVKTAKDRRAFVKFPFELYKGNDLYVPVFNMDERKLFGPKCMYSDVAESVFFLAYKDEKLVGRIHGINQLQYNQIHNTHQIRFTRFDSIDDQEVANALFDAVVAWGKSKNMDTLVGPLGFSDLEREGLLIQGFDEKQTYIEQYNFEYYQKLIENYGFQKDIDWLEFNLTPKKDLNQSLFKLADSVLKKNNYHLAPIKGISHSAYVKKYVGGLFDVLDESYGKLYGVVPMTERVKKGQVDNLKYIISKKLFRVILDKDEKVVSFAIMMPNISDAVAKAKGRLSVFRLMKALHKPKMVDLMLVGINPELQCTGIVAVYLKILYDLFDDGVESFETNLNLENNHAILNCWKYFNARHHKRRRCFTKSI